jgi:hypothetical protein
MNYVKPQVLNTKRASTAIMGTSLKQQGKSDNDGSSSVIAYRSDE